MDAQFLKNVVFVKDPTSFPDDMDHEEIVYELSKYNKLVILLSHGNEYKFSNTFILPSNVKVVPYSLDAFDSIVQCVILLREILKANNIELQSRHTEPVSLPIVLSGSILHVPADVKVSIINTEQQLRDQLKLEQQETSEPPPPTEGEWDV